MKTETKCYAVKMFADGQWFYLAEITEDSCSVSPCREDAMTFPTELDAKCARVYLPKGCDGTVCVLD